MSCPCGSRLTYEDCCKPFHDGVALPETAEALMRARYSAFAKARTGYLVETTWPASQHKLDETMLFLRAKASLWLNLKIIETHAGKKDDQSGTVLFEAKSLIGDDLDILREKSTFKKKSGRWYYCPR